MSSRGRRGRGRPPKSAVLSHRPSLLKKPRYLYAGSSSQSSRLGLPLRPYENSTPQLKQRLREKSQKVRSFIQSVLGGGDDEDNDFEPPPSSGDESDYQRAEDEEDDDDGSVASYESDDVSVYSQSSYSTISSSTPAKRKWTRRAHSPVFLQERELPALALPKSSEDLILPTCHTMRALSIYETLRHFRNILRLTPFRFEDFCVALMSDEQSALLSEAHIALLRAILREEEAAGTQFGPQDLKDSINVHLYMVDAVTWPAVLRMYLTSDPEYRPMLAALERCEYPFTAVASKLNVLEFLCDQFLTTAQAREDITSEGVAKHDDHCRVCHKLGDLLCCETCPAVYHLACLDPPLEDVPTEDWICTVCQANQVSGVTDCISDIEKGGLLSRQECLGLDRHGRKYWFLCRRIFVEGENNEAFYYSTPAQLEELLDVLDAEDLELDLCRTIAEFREEIVRHMELTEKLTNSSKGNRKTYLDSENAALAKVQAERAARRAKEEEERKLREAQEAEERRRIEEENAALAAASLESAAHRFLNAEDDGLLMPCPTKPEDGFSHLAEVPQMVEEEMNVASHANILDMGIDEPKVECGGGVEVATSEMLAPAEEQMEVETKPVVTETEEEVTTTTMVTTVVTTTTSTKTVTVVKVKEEDPDDAAKVESKAVPETKEGEEKEMETEQSDAKADDSSASADGKKPSEEDSAKKAAGKGTGKEEPDSGSRSSIVTRSKTGSLVPRSFAFDTTSRSTGTAKKSGGGTGGGGSPDGDSESVLVLTKDGEISRVTRSKATGAVALNSGSLLFKLGMEGSYRSFTNQYNSNTLALNKHQHAEDRDKRRHLSHKFSLTAASEFKWGGAVHGSRATLVGTLRQTLLQLESNIPAALLHPNWAIHRGNWLRAVNMCTSPRDFSLALAILEASVKPVLFNAAWSDSLGPAISMVLI
ncbi:hypothetical protein HPB51_009886 [Rhipicephalus microplus]|uniref:Nucleosome remodeling factor subunit n=1 Tax=Rhipicephalus microplus TaxID=6941 RepID=A0A9J6ES19_RHIMP|nr:hypothetical protein HPB51_009886 [Rhipicephalus microplus]